MRKLKFQKLSVNGRRSGELRFDTAYDAREAVTKAVKMARAGWTVEVQTWRSLGTRRGIHMTCAPGGARVPRRNVAVCTLSPSFKRQLSARSR